MVSQPELQEYLAEIRKQACSRCADRPAAGPPCAALGKLCSVELQLPLLVAAVHEAIETPLWEAHLGDIRRSVHDIWSERDGEGCNFPSESTLSEIIYALESVDQRRLWREWTDLGGGD